MAQFQRLRDRRSDSPGNGEGLPLRAFPLRGPPEAPPPFTDPLSEGGWNVPVDLLVCAPTVEIKIIKAGQIFQKNYTDFLTKT